MSEVKYYLSKRDYKTFNEKYDLYLEAKKEELDQLLSKFEDWLDEEETQVLKVAA